MSPSAALIGIVGGGFVPHQPFVVDGRAAACTSSPTAGRDGPLAPAAVEEREPIGPPEAVSPGLEGWYATPSPRRHEAGRREATIDLRACGRYPIRADRPARMARRSAAHVSSRGRSTARPPVPDGSGILLSACATVDGHFFWKLLAARAVRCNVLVREPMSHYWPRGLADGREIALSLRAGSATATSGSFRSPAGRRARSRTTAWAIDAHWSPDGQSLAYTEAGRQRESRGHLGRSRPGRWSRAG